MLSLLNPQPLFLSTGILLTRIFTGLFLIYHGWEIFDHEKIVGYSNWLNDLHFPSPYLLSFMGKFSELIAGIMLVIGLGHRIACLITALTMLFITFFLGDGKIFTDAQHPFLFFIISIILFFTGSGKWSLESKIYSSLKNKTNKY